MADDHTTLPAGAHRVLDDLPDVQVLGLVEEVHVEVGVDVEGARQREHDFDVLLRVGVVVGAAAHEVGAGARVEESPSPAPGGMPSWAKAQICRSIAGAYSAQRSTGPIQPEDGIDLDVRAHGRRPRRDRHVEHLPGAGADVVHGEAALGLAGQSDRFFQRARRGADPVGEQRLVEVDVGLDEPGRDEAPSGRSPHERPAPRGRSGDAPLGNGDVHHGVAIRQATLAEQQVDHCCVGRASRRATVCRLPSWSGPRLVVA